MLTKIVGLLLILSTSSVFAARFSPITEMSNSKLESVSQKYELEMENGGYMALGDCSSLTRLKITKNASELNINTMKQLSIRTGNVNHLDGEVISRDQSAPAKIVKDLVEMHGYRDFQDAEEESESRAFMTSFTKVLESASSSKVEFYSTVHSYEDGTWGLLHIYDTQNQEVIVIKAGICGT